MTPWNGPTKQAEVSPTHFIRYPSVAVGGRSRIYDKLKSEIIEYPFIYLKGILKAFIGSACMFHAHLKPESSHQGVICWAKKLNRRELLGTHIWGWFKSLLDPWHSWMAWMLRERWSTIEWLADLVAFTILPTSFYWYHMARANCSYCQMNGNAWWLTVYFPLWKPFFQWILFPPFLYLPSSSIKGYFTFSSIAFIAYSSPY